MTDHTPFIRAIIAQPDDDLPRLVYADYLDGRGECERARLIRLMTEHPKARIIAASGTNYSHHPSHYPRYWGTHSDRPVRSRWAANVVISMLPDPAEVQGFEAVSRRGFIEEITCSWQDWLTHSNTLLASTPLRRVALTTRPGVDLIPDWRSLPPHLITQMDNASINTSDMLLLNHRWPGIEFTLPPRPLEVRLSADASQFTDAIAQADAAVARTMLARTERLFGLPSTLLGRHVVLPPRQNVRTPTTLRRSTMSRPAR